MSLKDIEKILGGELDKLLSHKCEKISKDSFNVPGKDFVDRIFTFSNRKNSVLRNIQTIFSTGRLKDSGYLSILPVDQGIEHSAGSTFSNNPIYFDSENIVKLAIEGGCNGVVSSLNFLGMVSRKYSHKIPFIVKMNHNEMLSYPTNHKQEIYCEVDQAYDMGAIGVAATIYYGSSESDIERVAKLFAKAHERGMFTILWTYLRNDNFKSNGKDYHLANDMMSQANHLGATVGADIVKQKMPTIKQGLKDLEYNIYNKKGEELMGDHIIDMVRYQVLNSYSGRIGLINSGGASSQNDTFDILKNSIINKRAGGMGIIAGRKILNKSFKDGIDLLNKIQDVYLCEEIGLA